MKKTCLLCYGLRREIAGAPAPKDPVDHWIAKIAPNRTFVDDGGIGVNLVNERVTFAARAGAARVAMADIRPFSYYEWDVFGQKCAEEWKWDNHCLFCLCERETSA